MLAEKFAPEARAAEAMTEEHNRRRLLVRREINSHRNVAVPRRVVDRQVLDLRVKIRIDRERIISRGPGRRAAKEE